MSNRKDLPTRYKRIVVLFEMPGRKYTWWEAIINNITFFNTTNTKVRAIANVTYEEGADANGSFY